MKNKIIFSILSMFGIFLLSFAPSNYASAQEAEIYDPTLAIVPCPEPGCLEPWIKAQYTTTFSCPLPTGGSHVCNVTIYYRYRNNACGGTFQDLFIDGVKNNCNSLYCTVQDAYQQALEKLLLNNPMGFTMPTINGQCITTFRVQSTTCWTDVRWWKLDGIDFPETGYWWACRGTVCCVSPYRVCMRFGVLVVEKNGPSVPTGAIDCDDEPHTLDQCTLICN